MLQDDWDDDTVMVTIEKMRIEKGRDTGQGYGHSGECWNDNGGGCYVSAIGTDHNDGGQGTEMGGKGNAAGRGDHGAQHGHGFGRGDYHH
jgi:hypothetical protein